MTRGDQSAAQKRLLVFAIQLEDFDEQVLKHLNYAIYIRTPAAFQRTDLLPKLAPVFDPHHQWFKADEQVFS